MGKVRTESVKRLANELLRRYPRRFSTDFEANKNFLNSLGIKMTKKMRNRTVGYITQLKQMEARVSRETVHTEIAPTIT